MFYMYLSRPLYYIPLYLKRDRTFFHLGNLHVFESYVFDFGVSDGILDLVEDVTILDLDVIVGILDFCVDEWCN